MKVPSEMSNIVDPIQKSLEQTFTKFESYKSKSAIFESALNRESNADHVLKSVIEYERSERPFTSIQCDLKNKYIHLSLTNTSNSISDYNVKANGNTFSASELNTKPTSSSSVQEAIERPEKTIYTGDLQLSWTRSFPPGAGLSNLGNTCYLNATLQCLTYTAPLANYLLESFDHHERNCKRQGGNEFCLMCTMHNHIYSVLTAGRSKGPVRPNNIVNKLRAIAPQLRQGQQEDAHEFLRYVLDALARSSTKESLEHMKDPFYKQSTVINQIFGGYQLSQVICQHCSAASDTYDHFLDLNLDIKYVNTLTKALERYVQPEMLEADNAYQCPACGTKGPAKKCLTIYRSPNVLTFQLKRFDFRNFGGGKINRPITFYEGLDLNPYMSKRTLEKTRPNKNWYTLYAVLVHDGGSCNSGHYYSYVRNSTNNWFLMNDSEVRQVNANEVTDKQAYLLFYIKDEHAKLNSPKFNNHQSFGNKSFNRNSERYPGYGPMTNSNGGNFRINGYNSPNDNQVTKFSPTLAQPNAVPKLNTTIVAGSNYKHKEQSPSLPMDNKRNTISFPLGKPQPLMTCPQIAPMKRLNVNPDNQSTPITLPSQNSPGKIILSIKYGRSTTTVSPTKLDSEAHSQSKSLVAYDESDDSEQESKLIGPKLPADYKPSIDDCVSKIPGGIPGKPELKTFSSETCSRKRPLEGDDFDSPSKKKSHSDSELDSAGVNCVRALFGKRNNLSDIDLKVSLQRRLKQLQENGEKEGESASKRKKRRRREKILRERLSNLIGDKKQFSSDSRSSSSVGGSLSSDEDGELCPNGDNRIKWVEKTFETLQTNRDVLDLNGGKSPSTSTNNNRSSGYSSAGSSRGSSPKPDKPPSFIITQSPLPPACPSSNATAANSRASSLSKHSTTSCPSDVFPQSRKSVGIESLLNTSSTGYGTSVQTWGGDRTELDHDSDRLRRFEWGSNSYDDEYDRGKVKKVKHDNEYIESHLNGNRFQKEQNWRNNDSFRGPDYYRDGNWIHQKNKWSKNNSWRGHNGNTNHHFGKFNRGNNGWFKHRGVSRGKHNGYRGNRFKGSRDYHYSRN